MKANQSLVMRRGVKTNSNTVLMICCAYKHGKKKHFYHDSLNVHAEMKQTDKREVETTTETN